MANVLADLAIESEAATASALRLARAYDAAADDRYEHLLQRLLTPIVKYWTCKRAPQHAAEALECLGGNGFVEESMLPRLFRQSPLNGVWEGSGNVICLDVLRALAREPEALEAYWSEVARAGHGDVRLSRAVDDLRSDLSDPATLEGRARSVVERMALVFQASLLLRSAPGVVAEAFCASRLGSRGAGVFGTLPVGTDTAAILDRHTPA
jgi:putative acyl-CoA dehydrogenase